MRNIKVDDCIKLQERFHNYCNTAEVHQFVQLIQIDMLLGVTINGIVADGEVKDQRMARTMFRVVLKVMGEDYSEYLEPGVRYDQNL